jgi:hypothetical protein
MFWLPEHLASASDSGEHGNLGRAGSKDLKDICTHFCPLVLDLVSW